MASSPESSPPPSASERPPPEDEPELTHEALEGAAARRGIELRPVLNALSLALAAMLIVVAGGMGIQRLRSQPTTGAATPNPMIATPTPTAMPPPAPTLPAGQGWTPVGPLWAQRIVFAPSAPRTAYICGTPANSDGSHQAPVALGISHDAGHTWQTTTTPMLATVCQADVDPTDAHDLLLQVWRCTTCTPQPPAQLYRSVDGGHSWHLVTLPQLVLADFSLATFTTYQWAWQGSALFVSPYIAGSAGTQP